MIQPISPELDEILTAAMRQGAVEIYMLADEPPAIRTRDRSGPVVRLECSPLGAEQVEGIAVALLGREGVRALGPGVGAGYRYVQLSPELSAGVSAARAGGRVTVSIRPGAPTIFTPEQIRLPEVVLQAAAEPGGGLIVITGQKGSGKTTTCYTLLEHINATREVHMAILEQFAEQQFEPKRALIQHRQIGLDAPDMQGVLRAALLQNADVIFVGEITDAEILHACIRASEDRLVITQLHQPSPEAAVRLMLDLMPPHGQERLCAILADSLRIVLAQLLLERADGRGRIPAYGLIAPDASLRDAIRFSRTATELRDVGGARSLRQDVMELVSSGKAMAPEAISLLDQIPGTTLNA